MASQKVHCEGWWEQGGFGRQAMLQLQLQIDGNLISGTGTDIVGPFTLSGVRVDEKVTIKKQYIARHSVEYHGTYDGEGTMSGLWRIGFWGGKWLIKIVSLATEPDEGPAAISEWMPDVSVV